MEDKLLEIMKDSEAIGALLERIDKGKDKELRAIYTHYYYNLKVMKDINGEILN